MYTTYCVEGKSDSKISHVTTKMSDYPSLF